MAEALGVEPLRAGHPEVLVGGEALTRHVRWVHSSDNERIASLLEGGELLLTTGAAWPGGEERLRDLVGSLADAGAVGIVLELGGRFSVAPPALVQSCRERGVALAVLEREVKFVAVTEAVHRLIMGTQLEALRARQHVHDLFTALSLRGAPAETVVRETARILTAPVVLQSAAGEVVALAAAGREEAGALAGLGSGAVWEHATVEARGTRWGRIVAHPDAAHPAGVRTVLETAATALALGRLADGDGRAWERAASRMLVQALLTESFATPEDAVARLEASGFPLRGRVLHALVLRDADGDLIDAAAQALRKAGAVHAAQEGRDGVLLLSLPQDGAADVREAALRDVRRRVREANAVSGRTSAAAWGEAADTLDALAGSVASARLLAARAAPGELVRGDGRPLTRLAGRMHGDLRLAAFRAEMLGPLEEWDRAHRGDLLTVLSALVVRPSSRTAAAAASGLSRSVFYQRLALIEDLTGADLDDGETLAALHLALLTGG